MCVETSAYGRKYDAACICTAHIVDLQNTLCCLGVTPQIVNGSDASFMFGNNFSVFNSTVMTAGKLQCWSNIINYCRTQESQAKGIINFVHMNVNENPSDIMTKSRAYNTWYPSWSLSFSDVICISSKNELVSRRVKTGRQHPLSLSS